MAIPVLKGERVILRPVRVDDASVFIRWLKDKKVVRFLVCQMAPTLVEEKKWIREVFTEILCSRCERK